MYDNETKETADTRKHSVNVTKQDMILSKDHNFLGVGDKDLLGNGYVVDMTSGSNAIYESLDAVSSRHTLENGKYIIFHKEHINSVGNQDFLTFMVSPRKTITVYGGGVIPEEMAEVVHKMMQDKGLVPETDLDYISEKDSLDTISALGLAIDTEGNLYSKYNLPDNFHTPYDLTFENTLGVKNLPKGLIVDGTLTLADDTVSLEGDSKIKTLKLAEGGSLARLPDVAEEIVSDTRYAVSRIHNIDPKITLDKFVVRKAAEMGGNLTVEDIKPAQKNWTNELKSGKLPFKTKLVLNNAAGR